MEPDPSKLPRSVGIPIFSVVNPGSKEMDPKKISNFWDETGGKQWWKKSQHDFFSWFFSLVESLFKSLYTVLLSPN